MNFNHRLMSALFASGAHLVISLAIAAGVAGLVFIVWYPWPFDEMVQGRELFWLVVCVDVVCGPLLTLVLWNPHKPKSELHRDMALVLLIQVSALAYGIYTVAMARPVHLVFEVDRLRLVTAAEINKNDLSQAPPGLQNLPWTGPTLISTRVSRSGEETLLSIEQSLAGQEPSLRPGWWQNYALSQQKVLDRSKPMSVLRGKHPRDLISIDDAIKKTGREELDLVWLPFTSARATEWVVLMDKNTAIPLAFANLSGF